MAWKNRMYRGPDIMIKLMRATNIPWQKNTMRNGFLVSNALYRERYRPALETGSLAVLLGNPLETDTRFGHLGERELRNLHSQSSQKKSIPVETPNSKYVSMTSSGADTSWGEGMHPTVVFRFDIWRSDVWKGAHDLSRDLPLQVHIGAQLATMGPYARALAIRDRTPDDWDRGVEFEWLALGGTKIYNVEESSDGGNNWLRSVPTPGIDFWWEAI